MRLAKAAKKICRYFFWLAANTLLWISPKYFVKVCGSFQKICLLVQDTIVNNEAVSSQTVKFEGRWIDSCETTPANEIDLVKRIISSFCAAKEMQSKAPEPYQISGAWKDFLTVAWRSYYDAMSRGDLNEVAALLRNFFRNEGISGMWGGMKGIFSTFCHLDKVEQLKRATPMIQHHRVWRNNLPFTALKELDAPRVGNPWGFRFDEMLLYEPVFEYNFQAHYFNKLLSSLQLPIVVEIGGGFGGLAYHLLRCRPSIKYIGFDLPENILIQTYYLSCSFPNARILTYQSNPIELSRNLLEQYDIVLLPNFELPRLESLLADLIINVRSLSEMSYETITEYITQIDRIGRLFFYHENIYKARKDGIWGIPSVDFPALENFVLIAASESRWPKYQSCSCYPCQENLFIRKDALA